MSNPQNMSSFEHTSAGLSSVNIRREFEWDDRNIWGHTGWRFTGNAIFRPADARINAHDVIEHFEDDDGSNITGELEAIGAIWFGRIQSGYVFGPPDHAIDIEDCIHRNSNELHQVLQECFITRAALIPILDAGPPEEHIVRHTLDSALQKMVARAVGLLNDSLRTNNYLKAMEVYLALGGEAVSRKLFLENHVRLDSGALEVTTLNWIRHGFGRARKRFGTPDALVAIYKKVYEGISDLGARKSGERLVIDIDIHEQSVRFFINGNPCLLKDC